MHDEFRIQVDVPHERVRELLGALGSLERSALGDAQAPKHVAVSHDGDRVFVYADSTDDALRARGAIESTLAGLGIAAEPVARRWHPEQERWEDASAPPPSTPEQHPSTPEQHPSTPEQHPSTPEQHAGQRERAEALEAPESEHPESEQAGHVQWEVRVTLPSHHDAREFAERLQDEGYPLRRHWRHLQLGARDEDEAKSLATRLQAEAPEGSTVEVEGDAADAWAEVTAPARPFSVFGGLAQ